VLPPVAMLQFHALDCVELETPASALHTQTNHVLRVDTAVDCDSEAYLRFAVANSLLIVVYQSVPLVWFCLLWQHRRQLDPMNHGEGAVAHAALRNRARTAMGGKDARGKDDDDDDAAAASSNPNNKHDDRESFGGGFGSGWAERLSLGAGRRGSQQVGRPGRGRAGSVQKLTEGEVAAKERFRLDAETREAEVHHIRAKPR
jgi:hypothetical protein